MKSKFASKLPTLLAMTVVGVLVATATAYFVNKLDESEEEVAEQAELLEWESLMPPDFRMESMWASSVDVNSLVDGSDEASLYEQQMMAALASAPVVPSLAGRTVKIPGYVVPVTGDGETVTEFFLVPYFGACIHVPPPPANQIIYVRHKQGTAMDSLYDAVWVTGKLATEHTSHELAASGYSMEANLVEPYR